MKQSPLTYDQRNAAMRLMRAYGVPDEAIAAAFDLTRQRVHKLLGARAKDAPATYGQAGDEDATLPTALRTWRARRGLTQTEAAALLGVGQWQMVSRWERGINGCALAGLLLRHLELLDRHEPPTR